jgi:chromosome segregation ATPase
LKLPSLDSFSTRLPQLRQKQAEFHVEITNIKSQCAIIRARMQKSPNPGNEHEIRLRELLGETPVAVSLADPEQLRALQKELEALTASVSILDREILAETSYANKKLIESVKSEIGRLGSAFANAFAELHARHLEYDQLIDDLEDVVASVGMFRIRPNDLSHPKDRSGAYAYGLQEFIDNKFFSVSNLPKVLK